MMSVGTEEGRAVMRLFPREWTGSGRIEALWVVAGILFLVCALATMGSFGVAADGSGATGGSAPRRALLAEEEGSVTWWLQYASIPLVSGVVGWVTNMIALQMTFYPLEFWGLPIWQPKNSPLGLFGWQGIVPAKTEIMSRKAVRLLKGLVDMQEVFQRLDRFVMAELMRHSTERAVTDIVGKAAIEYFGNVWGMLPHAVQRELIGEVGEKLDSLVTNFMGIMQKDVELYLDIESVVVDTCCADKSILVDIFIACGDSDFRFIERSGFVWGFLFGILQAVSYYFYPAWWVLPLWGAIVGFITNWLALKMVFQPSEPYPLCGESSPSYCVLQGTFLKRQAEVSGEFARMLSTSVLTPRSLWLNILEGPKSPTFYAMLDQCLEDFIELINSDPPGRRQAMMMYMGAEKFTAFKRRMREDIKACFVTLMEPTFEYTGDALRLKDTMEEALMALPPDEFEAVLHPVFEEDEIKLILLGSALGALAGLFQAFVIFYEG